MRTSLLLFTAALSALAGCDSTSRTTTTKTNSSTSSTTVARPSYDSAASSSPGAVGPGSVEPDNTAVNKRDRDSSAKTPIDQNENQRDVNITAEIRKAVLATKDMSINARNVKIITADGKVTLRGPVNSEEEKEAIDAAAKNVAGKDNVTNEIEVKTEK